MDTRIATEHLKVELFQVSQGGKSFFVGIVPANFFIDVYTVNPVEYDFEKEVALKDNSPDMEDYFEKSLVEKKKTIDSKGFQRGLDPKREKEIVKFLNEEEYPFFPNAIIATLDVGVSLKDDKEDVLNKSLAENKDSSVLNETNGKYEIFLPKKRNSILVIDGQHRLGGLKSSGEVKEEYDLIVSFMLDYDRSVIASQFYTINYTQKSVNKSLLYHLTGEFSQDLDEITYLHEVVKLLNETEKSPLFGRVKMLGLAPKNLPREEKKLMTLSQAFLIDYLVYSIKDRKANSVIQPIFKYYYENNKYEIVRYLISYFTAVKRIFPEWNDPGNSILSKTIGVGALLKLMNYLFVKMFFEDGLDKNPELINNIKSDQIIEKLKGINNIDLNRFAGGSSAGTVNQLKVMMLKEIEYFDYDDEMEPREFDEKFKIDYSLRLKEWIQER